MKFAAALVFAAAAVASVNAADCTAAESATAFTNLAPLISSPDISTCATESGYDMLNTQGLPTDAMYAKMCKLDACKSLIKSVIATKPPQCALVIPTSQAKLNVYELTTGFDSECKRVGSGAGASASSNSTSSGNSTASGNSTSSSNSTTKAPTAVSTTKPSTGTTSAPAAAATPAPTTSAASSSVLAAGVAAVAVAAFVSA